MAGEKVTPTFGDLLHHLEAGEVDNNAALVLQHVINHNLPIERSTPLSDVSFHDLRKKWPFQFTEVDDPIHRIPEAIVVLAFTKFEQLKLNPQRIVRRQ